MKAFLELFKELDQTNSSNEKKAALTSYFKKAPKKDAAWALYFLSGRRIRSLITSRQLSLWAEELANLPDWLFMECRAATGDSAETASLLLPEITRELEPLSLSEWLEERILPLKDKSENEKREAVLSFWGKLPQVGKFILNKILGRAFRVGVSQQLVVSALAKAYKIKEEKILSKLQGAFTPSEAFFESMLLDKDPLLPYPFYLASPLDRSLEELGSIDEFFVEWKWDGIRCQAIKNSAGVALWSRGGELITATFPELKEALEKLTFNGILDGELLVFENERPKPFGSLQRRLGRKKVTTEHLEKYPAIFMAYDILQIEDQDLREKPILERRALLEKLLTRLKSPYFKISKPLQASHWQEISDLRNRAGEFGTEGLMIKKKTSIYGYKREKGYWWKYKVDPFSIDAVLIYAEPGSGRRSGQYTDYTFGVWEGEELIPVAKAYSGLTLKEIAELDHWIRRHTVEKFGPVRMLEPFHVFEIRFEGIQESNRHKAKLALRFPRMGLWRKDKTAEEADTLENLRILLKQNL